YAHTAIYDPVRDRMLVLGGTGVDNMLWALGLSDPPAWTQLAIAGPNPPRLAWHTAVYDPAGDRMIVFGGDGGHGYLNDVWALTLSGTPAWTQLVPTGTPPGVRADHTAILDTPRNRMIVFGGT